MKIAHNKVSVNKETQKTIRSLFFQQKEMKDIVKETNLTERIIRRIINEHQWIQKRERYLRYLASYAYLHDIPLENIADQTKTKIYAICRIHKKYHIPKPKKFAWNDKRNDRLEQSIVQDYQGGLTGQEVAKKHGYQTRETIYQILDKNGIDRKPSHVYTYYNESFFEKIDSHEKAYMLGLIMTDGYIIKDYEGFGIQLTEEDGYILEKIRDLVGGTNPITHINCSNKRKILRNTKDMCRLHVFSKKIAEDLKKLGVVRRKTKVLRYNGCVPKEYMSSFFRGLLDGDGSIGFNARNYPWLYIFSSSSYGFVLDVRDLIQSKTSIRNHGNNHWILAIGGGRKGMMDFARFIYKNKGDLYLRRKYGKVQDKIS